MRRTWSVVYSLHATKVLGAGEGAIVVCGNQDQADLLRAWSNFGFSSDRTSEIQGTNAKMSEMSAAYGLYSIRHADLERADWIKSQELVSSQSRDCGWTTFVNSQPQFHPYWISSFKDEEERNRISTNLKQTGIQSREWWAKPLSLQKTFSNSRTLGACVNAKFLSDTHLGLPMYRGLSSSAVLEICHTIQTSLKR
jgi:dTDP-4-amino-4,6-dideoxygalactose transaminase